MTNLEAIESIYNRFKELNIINDTEPSDIKDALEFCRSLLLMGKDYAGKYIFRPEKMYCFARDCEDCKYYFNTYEPHCDLAERHLPHPFDNDEVPNCPMRPYVIEIPIREEKWEISLRNRTAFLSREEAEQYLRKD